ncbi:hypothetical protein C8J57DRAFT_1214702 [Mycena rebaudengoi]|nr:hypothetical protein C8J57DRAFT_1214702 [Mycena rebaudengoi]
MDLDLTNGARGEIVDIVLDPDELPVEDAPIVFAKVASIHFRGNYKCAYTQVPVCGRDFNATDDSLTASVSNDGNVCIHRLSAATRSQVLLAEDDGLETLNLQTEKIGGNPEL